MNVSVARSPVRMLAYAALAVPAILLAVDMLFSHRYFPDPESTNQVVGSTIEASGKTVAVTTVQLTVDGKAQHRRDLVVGVALLFRGIAAMGGGLTEMGGPTGALPAPR